MITIEHRAFVEVCTDPQRRCYDGAWFSSEFQWTAWSDLESFVKLENADSRLEFWRDLNAYAVRERGKGALKEFRVREETK